MNPDVVIPVRDRGPWEHLRFALRSIKKNHPARVILIGGRPDWYSGDHLPTAQGRDKFTNQETAMRVACQTETISDPFVWWCDDHYLLTPAVVPRAARSDWATANGMYQKRMTAARQLLEAHGLPTLNYELHLPMVIDKFGMMTALDLGGDMRTIYGNLTRYADYEMADVKLKAKDPWPEGPWVSTSKASFQTHRGHLENLFPTPSQNEVT